MAEHHAGVHASPGASTMPHVTYDRNPRRTSPENSVTLRHHRVAREVSRRNASIVVPKMATASQSPQGLRRNSSDESNETATSDPKAWFNQSNAHPYAAAYNPSLDIDPPFYQKETDSSEEFSKYAVPTQSPAYDFVQNRKRGLTRPGLTHKSSSADDYRSVIDDLTIENKRLREELKRCRQRGPNALRDDRMFEVKVHGLPSRKKRELENTLRDFTTSLDGSSASASWKKAIAKGRPTLSKHASSSSGSRSRPVPTDSAYGSMPTSNGSTAPSIPNKPTRESLSAEEQYLRDIPEGLWPKSMILSEKDKTKLVVRRLEQLFTGKGISKGDQLVVPETSVVDQDVEMRVPPGRTASPLGYEPYREAQMLPQYQRDKTTMGVNGSPSNSNDDQGESRDLTIASGGDSGGKTSYDSSPPDEDMPQQRPTRPRDLDPDRAQVPSENMEYIRHLGLEAPEKCQFSTEDVSPDAEGWVYLNLLCNLAQLHIFNVTPAFIRHAVSEKSKLFQLSADGRKVRWRGGAEGTRFSSDSSGNTSQRSNEDTDGSTEAGQRKKQRTAKGSPKGGGRSGSDEVAEAPSRLGPQVSDSGDSLQYKPLFVHRQTSSSDTPVSNGYETGSSYGAAEESNLGMRSAWNHSVSGPSQRKRRRDGAIIYYSGAPFCTDLSGDQLSDAFLQSKSTPEAPEPSLDVTAASSYDRLSGSNIPLKPLSSLKSHDEMMDLDSAPPQSAFGGNEASAVDEMEAEFPWPADSTPSPDSEQSHQMPHLEASGLAGITPEDHFAVTVSTKRTVSRPSVGGHRTKSKLLQPLGDETVASGDATDNKVGVEYLDGQVRQLPPAPLPPPAYFYNMSDGESDSDSDEESDFSVDDCEAPTGALINSLPLVNLPVKSGDDEELSSGDEEDEHSEAAVESDVLSTSLEVGGALDEDDDMDMDAAPPGIAATQRSARLSSASRIATGSSVATVGGAGTGSRCVSRGSSQ